MGRVRLAWVDFSAGPFSWGPVVGAAGAAVGLRTAHSLPSVAAAFGAQPLAVGPQPTSAELEAALEEMADKRFGEMDAEDEAVMLEAELDVYEMFAQARVPRGPRTNTAPVPYESLRIPRGFRANPARIPHGSGTSTVRISANPARIPSESRADPARIPHAARAGTRTNITRISPRIARCRSTARGARRQ